MRCGVDVLLSAWCGVEGVCKAPGKEIGSTGIHLLGKLTFPWLRPPLGGGKEGGCSGFGEGSGSFEKSK